MTAPTTRMTSLDDALGHISAEDTVWVRVAAVRRDDGSWAQRLLELTSGEPPPSWDRHVWEYPAALFLASYAEGSVVAEWLRAGQINLDGYEIHVPEMSDGVYWDRRQSRSPGAYEALDWAVMEAGLSQSQLPNEPPGHLVGDRDTPSFVSFYTAGANFFWLDSRPVGGALNQGAMYRHQDTRCRINGVRISDDTVEVVVEGEAMDALTVELAGDAPGLRERIWKRSRTEAEAVAKFVLKEGLPPGAWVLVRHESEWIDRRFLSVPWTRGDDAGVEVVVEPRTRLEAFLANREGAQAEFKRDVPTDDRGKAKTMKTICAFANESGGSVLFGIDDDHNLTGIVSQRVDRLKDQLSQVVDSWIEPRPNFEFGVLPISDSESVVLEVRVAPGPALYGCAKPGEVPGVYVRHLATTVRARPAEIEAIVRRRNASTPTWQLT